MINRQTAQDATARAGILMLFMLTMFLAGMILSNLVEEKGTLGYESGHMSYDARNVVLAAKSAPLLCTADARLDDLAVSAALDAMRAGLLPPSTPFRDLDETLAQFAEGGLMAVQAMVGGQLGAAAERDELRRLQPRGTEVPERVQRL